MTAALAAAAFVPSVAHACAAVQNWADNMEIRNVPALGKVVEE